MSNQKMPERMRKNKKIRNSPFVLLNRKLLTVTMTLGNLLMYLYFCWRGALAMSLNT